MQILVGTASWTDKALIASKKFYPRGCSTAEARLRYYAGLYPLVEVDSSYYAMPSPANSELWVERTPAAFTMNMKAFRLFTGHQTSPIVLPRDVQMVLGPIAKRHLYYRDTPAEILDELWRRFHLALAPLQAAGKLGLVHFQFPPWLTCNREGHAHVAHCVERMAGFTVSVEFRHQSWFSERHRDATLAFERELEVVHTVVDGPQGFSNSVPPVWAVTRPSHALLRLHGRNVDTWNIQDASSSGQRFNYDYSEPELTALVPDLHRLAAGSVATHVVFNNNMEDQGQRNAASLMRLL